MFNNSNEIQSVFNLQFVLNNYYCFGSISVVLVEVQLSVQNDDVKLEGHQPCSLVLQLWTI